MKLTFLKIISYMSLAGTIIPSLLVFFGDLNPQVNKQIMAISMVVWFATAPLWINKKSNEVIE